MKYDRTLRGTWLIDLEEERKSPGHRWIYSMPLWYFSTSIIGLLLILQALSEGGAFEVSLVLTISTAGVMFGSLFWSRYVARSGRYTLAFLIGFSSLFLGYLALYLSQRLEAVLAVAFCVNFFSLSTYYGAVYLVRREFEEEEKGLSKLEALGGLGSIGGMLFASLFSATMGNTLLSLVIALISLTAMILSMLLLGQRIPRRMIEEVKEDLGIFPLIERMLNFITRQEERVAEITSRGIGFVARGGVFVEPWAPRIGFPKTHRFLHLASLLAFFAFGAAFSQMYTLFKAKDISDPFIYSFSIVSNTVATISYRGAGKSKASVNILSGALLARAGIILALALSIFMNTTMAETLYFILHAALGFTWAYLIISISSIFLRIGEEALGINNFLRQIGYIIGSSLSAVIVLQTGLATNFLMAAITLLGAVALLKREHS
jgi:MFS family permease